MDSNPYPKGSAKASTITDKFVSIYWYTSRVKRIAVSHPSL